MKATLPNKAEKSRKGQKTSKERQLFHLLLMQTCKNMKIQVKEEHLFAEGRKFRFDYAIPELMVAVEYEGVMSGKARHTTIGGYSKDCEKYNLAAANGWKLLRYTALNYSQVTTDLLKFKQ